MSSTQKQILEKYKETAKDADFELDDDTLDFSYSKFSQISAESINLGEFPFVTKIQTNVNEKRKLQDIKHQDEMRSNVNSVIASDIYPIAEHPNNDLHSETNENALVPLKSLGKSLDLLMIPKNRRNISVIKPESTPRHQQLRATSVKMSLTPAQRVDRPANVRLVNALENFQFGEMVGRGAFATVYKGVNLKTNQLVAIKQIILDKDHDVQELMGEIDLLKILKHPNIVKYHGFVKTSSSLNVFLEFCSGGSLRQLYKRNNSGVSESDTIRFVKLILNGLNYLHEQGVVHRDVKAANVLLTETGDIKLADFGVATKITNQHLSIVGTPNWMAPETILGGEGLCTASDIWSLGATIIELITMNPPYHDLNPMATLHAIGSDEHPPLPTNISILAKDFLLECFQKQPRLRKSAHSLLKHKWLHEYPGPKVKRSMASFAVVKSINSYSESLQDDWEKDFEEMTLSKDEKLQKFADTNEESFVDFNISGPASNVIVNKASKVFGNGDDDPFLDIEVENFDTNELAIQSKMEFLITKFSNRVDLCQSGNEEVLTSLIKVIGKIAHLVKKYPILHDVLIRDHGIVSIFELLENASDLPNISKLWYYSLVTLNYIFESNINQFENFCLIGGIPVITKFRNNRYDNHIKLEVVRFLRIFVKSTKALSMFISCGGLRVLAKFAEEDFDVNPQFPLLSIELIHVILTTDLSNSKSDLCRKLSHYGIIFWFIVLLHRLTKEDQYDLIIDKIILIAKYFGQLEVKVRINISSPDLFKLILKSYSRLSTENQLVILKFIRSMSFVLEILKHLQAADILEFIVSLIKVHVPSTEHYKEFINVLSPILYNYCYLNHSKESELVKLGAVPYLRDLSRINLPFKQFVLPILCELVYCDRYVHLRLVKHNILDVYLNLLLDPYWQANSLDSILNWYKQDGTLNLTTPKAVNCLTSGFMMNKVSSLELALDNYLKLITIHPLICKQFCKKDIVTNILDKLTMENAVVQLTLLKILKVLLGYMSNQDDIYKIVKHRLETIAPKKSVLVGELTSEILRIVV